MRAAFHPGPEWRGPKAACRLKERRRLVGFFIDEPATPSAIHARMALPETPRRAIRTDR